jgi:hypothetical protein
MEVISNIIIGLLGLGLLLIGYLLAVYLRAQIDLTVYKKEKLRIEIERLKSETNPSNS